MDTPPNNLKSWAALTARARAATPPDIDVRLAVRRAITASPRPTSPPENFIGEFSRALTRPWLTASLAALTLIAGTSGYLGFRALPEVTLALGLSSLF